MVYQYMSVFKYDFSTNFSSFLTKKESFFVKNWRLLIIFSIDNRFLTLTSWEKVLWTSKHHFWEVHFLWPKWSFKCKNENSFSYYRFTMDNLVWNIRNVSHFLHLKFSFWSQKMDFSKMMFGNWKSIEPFLKNLESKNDYQF